MPFPANVSLQWELGKVSVSVHFKLALSEIKLSLQAALLFDAYKDLLYF